jgi:8-oxo-dGTP pyrophosphatase MutT (NUDIX family)
MTDYFLGGEGKLTPGDASVALIVLEDGSYLLQHRDQMPGIFYPGHWGLFGGAIDPGETPSAALRRELNEELGLTNFEAREVTDLTIGFGPFGRVVRVFFEVRLSAAAVAALTLNEGREMRSFHAKDILTMPRVAPYDSMAIWLHAAGWLEPAST